MIRKKLIYSVLASLVVVPLLAQQNIVKTNLGFPISLGYERTLNKRMSLVVYAHYVPQINYSDQPNIIDYKSAYKVKAKGISIELKSYLSNAPIAPKGFYVSPFVFIGHADCNISTTLNINNAYLKVQETGEGVAAGPLLIWGGKIGYQWIWKHFSTDLGIGISKYNFKYTRPTIVFEKAKLEFSPDLPSQWAFIRDGISPQLNLALGYAF